MDKLYTIQEVATKLNLSDKTLRRWEEAGRFSSSRTLGNQRRYSLEDLQILDAIKHGTINTQKDLLNVEQASRICGVSPATIMRWEEGGKIHPMITSGETYYIRPKLMEKMDELKKSYPEPAPVPPGSDLEGRAQPRTYQGGEGQTLQDKGERTVPNGTPQSTIYHPRSIFINLAITITLLLTYHFLFNQPSAPISPQSTGSVQGAATVADPRLSDLITKFQDHLATEMLANAKPIPVTTINLAGTSLITGSSTLSKNQNQISVPAEQITPTTPVTVTFTSDYAPAKKYWVTPGSDSFTLHTDFPVGTDSTFNYSFLSPTSTASAIIKP